MREMVLNHASLASPDEYTCGRWLQDLASGIRVLVAQGVAELSLRMHWQPAETECLPGYSLFDAMLAMTAQEERLFLLQLSAKTPLITAGEAAYDRFLGCEPVSLSPADGGPLLLCVIQNWIAVSFPSAPQWERDSLEVTFEEMLPDGECEQAIETIDNLASSAHATPICERHRARFLQGVTLWEQWERRDTVFPCLQFGPDVHSNVREQQTNLTTIIHRLHDLSATIATWRVESTAIPHWLSRVSQESTRIINNPRLKSARMFRSGSGATELFDWHARYGDGGRIHFRLELQSRTIEIGYIGPHLPL